MKKLGLVLAATVSAMAMPAAAATLYSNDFDSAAFVAAGVTVSSLNNGSTGTALAGAWNAQGWTNSFFKNDSTGNPALLSQLTLSGIGAHTSISLGGMLGFLGSWDSTDGSPAPDFLEVYVDGTLVTFMTTNNASGTIQNYAGSARVYHQIQADTEFFYTDSLAEIGSMNFATFAHTGSTLTLGIRAIGAGWQGGGDESWGIDNLVISYNPGVVGAVPEPATWAMMLAGFGIVGSAMRRRQRVAVSYG